jgi:uncharacterized protein with von Willebrand factor type A (vWA) domain
VDRDPDKIMESYLALQQMFASGVIDERVLHKMTIEAAYELSEIGEFPDAITIVNNIPMKYFESTLKSDMEEDERFAVMASTLAEKLHERGLVNFGISCRPTQKQANA